MAYFKKSNVTEQIRSVSCIGRLNASSIVFRANVRFVPEEPEVGEPAEYLVEDLRVTSFFGSDDTYYGPSEDKTSSRDGWFRLLEERLEAMGSRVLEISEE